ncbi:MAG: hypothetical protein WCF35_10645, partial [Pseudolabrys sp.]
ILGLLIETVGYKPPDRSALIDQRLSAISLPLPCPAQTLRSQNKQYQRTETTTTTTTSPT